MANSVVIKPVVKQKPIPTYLKPVPPLSVEELPPTAEDIAWDVLNGDGYYPKADSDLKDDIEIEQRAAKRRRIRACAEAYLKGESLYIMSAQLKGPCNDGWRNPWGRKRSGAKESCAVEPAPSKTSATAKRMSSGTDTGKAIYAEFATPGLRPTSRESHNLGTKQKRMKVEDALSASRSKPQNPPLGSSPKVPRQAKEKRVEEWLQRNNPNVMEGGVLVHSSPTPSGRRRQTPKQVQNNEYAPRSSQSEPPMDQSPVSNTQRTAVSFQLKDTLKVSKAAQRVQKLTRDMQNVIEEQLVQISGALQDEVRTLAKPNSSSKNWLDSTRAEFAILQAKRGASRKVSADTHMSPFEFRKVSEQNKESFMEQAQALSSNIMVHENDQILINPTVTIDRDAMDHTDEATLGVVPGFTETAALYIDDDNFATAPEPHARMTAVKSLHGSGVSNLVSKEQEVEGENQPLANNPSRPPLSNAVSDLSTAEMLPSAQPRPDVTSNVWGAQRDEKLVSIKPITSESEKSEQVDEVERSKSLLEPADDSGHEQHEDPEKHIDTSTALSVNYVHELVPQEMHTNTEPLNLSAAKSSNKFQRKGTPATATNTSSDKKRKKASFAIDPALTSSLGSIKDLMKAKVSKQLGGPPSFLLEKDPIYNGLSDEDNGLPHKRLKPVSSGGKPKGILKSTNPSSSPNSQKKSKHAFSTGQEQDGQQKDLVPAGGGLGVMGEDNFDLDAAIDDLGSFLGTWDAEKEASSLDIKL